MRTCAVVLAFLGWPFLAGLDAAETNRSSRIELHVRNVVYVRESSSPVVVLMDEEEKRFLPIWIGFGEAHAIAMELYAIKPPRPMTHDLIRSLVAELDGTVDNLTITEIRSNTYHANLHVTAHGRSKTVDCRPSDGIAVVLRTKSPIFVDEAVMKNALPVPEEARAVDAGSIDALGITAQTLTPDLAAAFGYETQSGVLVTNSRNKDLRRGDVIVAVGSEPVGTVAELNAALANAKPGATLKLQMIREGNRIEIEFGAMPGGT